MGLDIIEFNGASASSIQQLVIAFHPYIEKYEWARDNTNTPSESWQDFIPRFEGLPQKEALAIAVIEETRYADTTAARIEMLKRNANMYVINAGHCPEPTWAGWGDLSEFLERFAEVASKKIIGGYWWPQPEVGCVKIAKAELSRKFNLEVEIQDSLTFKHSQYEHPTYE